MEGRRFEPDVPDSEVCFPLSTIPGCLKRGIQRQERFTSDLGIRESFRIEEVSQLGHKG